MLLQKLFDSSVHNSFPFFSRTVLSEQVGRYLVGNCRKNPSNIFFSTKTQHAILFLCHTQLIHVQFTRTFSQRYSQLPIFECFFPDRNWINISSIHAKKITLLLRWFSLSKIFVPNYCEPVPKTVLEKFAGNI